MVAAVEKTHQITLKNYSGELYCRPGVPIFLFEGVHLRLAAEGKMFLYIIYFQILIQRILVLQIIICLSVHMLIKIQWIFVILLKRFCHKQF